MGKPVAGEVVVFPFPQTNLQSGKRRPVFVVADLTGNDLVLCQVTRKARSDDLLNEPPETQPQAQEGLPLCQWWGLALATEYS
jgi:hypothetical protein